MPACINCAQVGATGAAAYAQRQPVPPPPPTTDDAQPERSPPPAPVGQGRNVDLSV